MEKRLPSFWHPSFDSSEVIFGSDLLKGRGSFAFVLHLLFLLCRRFFGIRFALIVPFVPKIFWFGSFERSKSLSVLFAHFVPLVPKVFWFRPFLRSKPLGVRFALIVPLVPKVFCFGPLKGRSPLAFVLHLLCLLCRRFFGSDL